MSKITIDNPVEVDVTAVPDWVWSLPVSFRAKTLFCFFLSLPGGFLPCVGQVEQITGLGRDARRSAYRELQGVGLLASRAGTWSVRQGGAL